MSFIQSVSNWLLGDYRVSTTKLSDGSLVQHIRLTDDSGAYVSPSGTTAATTGTHANVAGSASNVTLIAANSSRKNAIIFNDSSAPLYVKFGATASNTDFALKLFPNETWEMGANLYTGIIDGIWDSATGNARVTEWT